jgi:hypothetical protein
VRRCDDAQTAATSGLRADRGESDAISRQKRRAFDVLVYEFPAQPGADSWNLQVHDSVDAVRVLRVQCKCNKDGKENCGITGIARRNVRGKLWPAASRPSGAVSPKPRGAGATWLSAQRMKELASRSRSWRFAAEPATAATRSGYAATLSGSRTGTRSRSFGATCSMNRRIDRATFSGVAHFLPVTISSVPKPPASS